MATKFEVEKKKYIQALEELKVQHEIFRRENVKKTSKGTFTVYTAEPIDFYIALSNFIHSAAIIIETGVKGKMSGKNRSFISAIRYVDNLIKHEEQEINIDELMSSTPKLGGQVKNAGGKFSFKPETELVSFWKDIPARIKVDERNKGQKANYDIHLRGKKVMKTMDTLDGIVKNYISFT